MKKKYFVWLIVAIIITTIVTVIFQFINNSKKTYNNYFVLMPYENESQLSDKLLAVNNKNKLYIASLADVKNKLILETQVKFYQENSKIMSAHKKGYFLTLNKEQQLVLGNKSELPLSDINIKENSQLNLINPQNSNKLITKLVSIISSKSTLPSINDNIKTTSPQPSAPETTTQKVSRTDKINIKISEINTGKTIINNEEEASLKPIVLSPIPSGGYRLAYMGNDSKVHITALTDDNKINGNSIAISCNDFSDMFAHNDGGVLMLTRAKKSGSESLLNYPPEKPIPCYGMYLVKFNNSGKEIWSKEITNTKLPYTDNAIFVWWYAHHGRIAFSGSNYAAYYGCAISVNGDIHQGDRQTIVSSNGTIKSGGWNWGCSHSGYELVIWDKYKKRFASICKTDNNDRIMYNVSQTIKGIDLWYSNLGSPVPDKKGGYWLVVSDRQNGQPAKQDGYADVHLVHFNPNGKTDKDIIIAGKKDLNERAPHLSAFGEDQLLASWESTTSKGDIRQSDSNRKFFIQSFNISSGKAISKALQVNIRGNRYQDLVSFPDGSAAFVSKGSSITKIKIARFYPDNILTSPDISISGNKNPDQTNNVAKSNSTKNIENIIYVNNNLEVTAKSYNWILTDLNNILVYS